MELFKRFLEDGAAIALGRRHDETQPKSPVTADVLRACGLHLVNEKTPSVAGNRRRRASLEITPDELIELLRIPSVELADLMFMDLQQARVLASENPVLYRITRELAKRAVQASPLFKDEVG